MRGNKKITAWVLAAALCMGSLAVPGTRTKSAAAEPEFISSNQIKITADDYQSGNEPVKAIDGRCKYHLAQQLEQPARSSTVNHTFIERAGDRHRTDFLSAKTG